MSETGSSECPGSQVWCVNCSWSLDVNTVRKYIADLKKFWRWYELLVVCL